MLHGYAELVWDEEGGERGDDDLFLSNYVAINLNDFIASLPGVGQARITGERRYGMRLWLDPDKLAKLGLTATDIRQIVSQQNRQNPAGQIGDIRNVEIVFRDGVGYDSAKMIAAAKGLVGAR